MINKYYVIFAILFSNFMFGQVSVGTTTPDPSAILELQSNSKGFLLPRLTTTERDAIVSPAEGLMVFNSTLKCIQLYDGLSWSNCLLSDLAYKTLVCPPAAIKHGVFAVGTSLNTSNNIVVQATTSAATSYSITTNTVNGYSFSASGVFPSAGTYNVLLAGNGTPINAQTDSFTISMSGTPGTCNVDVQVLNTLPVIYANCKEYKNNGFNTDGIYTIDPDGVGGNDPINCYCDMTNDGGGWTLLFRHDSSGGFFADNAQADSFNEATPEITTKLYSILNKMDQIKSLTDYEFRLSYPLNGVRNHWTQTFNPRSGVAGVTPVPGYTPITIDASGNYWGGLERSTSTSTYLDGSVNSSNWWYSIGSNVIYVGGIPGYDATVVTFVELYVR